MPMPEQMGGSQQMLGQFVEHNPVSFGREMYVAINEESLVPIFMRVSFGKECRKNVDEILAVLNTKILPNRDLPTFAIVIGKLHGPGIDGDGQGNPAFRQQIGKLLHVLLRSRYAALDAKWSEVSVDSDVWQASPRRPLKPRNGPGTHGEPIKDVGLGR